jgi:hypothetical protein
MQFEKFIAEGKVFKDRESSTRFLNELGSTAVGYFGGQKHFEELVSSILADSPEANLTLLDDFRILVIDK